MQDILVQIISGPIPLESARQSYPLRRDSGAVVEFLGVVRESENDTPIEGLHYEAYEKMAHAQLGHICVNLASKYGITCFHVIHRLGYVPVGEPSLYIRIASKHRKEAFLACQEFIDLLKQDVPIWKSSKNK